MKTKFFISPIGRPLFYSEIEQNRSDKATAYLIGAGGLYFVIRIILGVL